MQGKGECDLQQHAHLILCMSYHFIHSFVQLLAHSKIFIESIHCSRHSAKNQEDGTREFSLTT